MPSPKKYCVLAKVEATQFTDAVPTSTTDAILCTNLKCTPLRVESESRALDRAYYGNSDQIPVLVEAVIEFDVEIAGGGAAGTIPKWGPLMKGCSFAETNSPGVSTIYNPVSSAFQYLTIYAYRDNGVLYKLLGCHGNVSIAMEAKKIPHFHFRFMGKYAAVTDVAMPANPTLTGWQQPRASIPTYTGTLTWNTYAAKVGSFSVDIANDVQHAIWMNKESVENLGRAPKGKFIYDATTVATHDYWTEILQATTAAFTLTHGTTAGNTVKFDAPKMQLVDQAETTFQGYFAYESNFALNPNIGNDEFTITVT